MNYLTAGGNYRVCLVYLALTLAKSFRFCLLLATVSISQSNEQQRPLIGEQIIHRLGQICPPPII